MQNAIEGCVALEHRAEQLVVVVTAVRANRVLIGAGRREGIATAHVHDLDAEVLQFLEHTDTGTRFVAEREPASASYALSGSCMGHEARRALPGRQPEEVGDI